MQDIVLALAVLCDPIAVEMNADANEQGLRGQLVMRLVEEGFCLAAHAERRLVVAVEPAGAAAIEVHDGARVQRTTVDGGPASAVHLEVLHRAVDLLRALPALTTTTAAERIAIEARETGGQSVQAPVRLLDALLARGLVLAPADTDVTWRICLLRDGTRWAHLRVPGRDSCTAAQALLAMASAQPQADMVAAIDRELDLPAPAPEPPPARPVAPRVPTRPAPSASTRPAMQGLVALGGGVAFRLRAAEPLARVRVGVAHRSGFGALAQATFLPSRTRELQVLDTAIDAGPMWTRPVAKRMRIGIGVAAGVLVHRWTKDGSTGSAVDVDVTVPAWCVWRVVGPLHLGFELEAGVASRSRRHVVGADTIWRRDAVRLGAGVTLALAWGGER